MNPEQANQTIALPSERGASLSNLAFDGCHYYFSCCDCKILKYNLKFEEIGCIETGRDFNCLCYDFAQDCFWASSSRCHNRIFKLDYCFKELDSIHFCPPKDTGGVITGISFDCSRNKLLVACTGSVLEIDKENECVTLLYTTCNAWISGILSLSPGYCITIIKDGIQKVVLFNGCHQVVTEECVPPCYLFKNIICNPCKSLCDNLTFYVLASKKGCYPCILKYIITSSELGFTLNPCNYDICRDCRPPHHPICPGGKTSVLESIALVETALSHILNAEGEKLQKVLASTDDVELILCVNREINQTIINATNLEHTLYAKLTALNGFECDNLCKKIDCTHLESAT